MKVFPSVAFSGAGLRLGAGMKAVVPLLWCRPGVSEFKASILVIR